MNYHIKQKPWAALRAAATARNLVPLLKSIRTWFGIASGHSAKEADAILPCDSSADMPAARPKPAVVLPSRPTNADQPEQPPKQTALTGHTGVVYQAQSASQPAA